MALPSCPGRDCCSPWRIAKLPGALGEVHGRYRTPVNTIIATTAVVLVLALSGSFIYFVKVTLIARISVYAITYALLPVFRRRCDVPKAAFMLPGDRVLACVACYSWRTARCASCST
jgi:amino acid transporter